MREQLTKYVELLFAGAPHAQDIQQEILQNTLDRYDDLIDQGKSPEAAYSLSISGIGDISEILERNSHNTANAPSAEPIQDPAQAAEKRMRKAVAIAFFILCPIPLFILSEFGADTIGLCLTLLLVAAGTALMILNGKDQQDEDDEPEEVSTNPETSMREKTRESIHTLIWCIGLAVYLIISFATGAWHITWVMFPLIGCVQGLMDAISDLKEAR